MAQNSGIGGLFTGFLSGAALCLVAFAALAYVFPLRTSEAPEIAASATTAPETLSDESAQEDQAPDAIAADDGNVDVAIVAPTAEVPEADRDTSKIILQRPNDAEQTVQTGTPVLDEPVTSEDVAASSTEIETDAPTQVETPEPIVTEEAPVAQAAPEVASEPETPATTDLAELSPNVSEPEASTPPAVQSEEQPSVQAPTEPMDTTPSVSVNAGNAPSENLAPAAPTLNEADSTPAVVPAAPSVPSGSNVVAMSDAPSPDGTPRINVTPSEAPKLKIELDEEPVEDAPSQPETEPSQTEPELQTAPAPPELTGKAFDAFAADYVVPDDRPLLSIILEDVSGDEGVSEADLESFGAAVTYGIDPNDTRARFNEAAYRAAGFEVVVIANGDGRTDINSNTDPATLPSTVEQYLRAVPGAVALIDAPTSEMYRDPKLVAFLGNELNKTGRGLLIHEKFGVNRALEAARSIGVPSASMLRIIDDTRDGANIRRALDRAALDAGKTGAAIVFGRTYPETMAAILPWLLSSSARSVNLAPLTATMERLGN